MATVHPLSPAFAGQAKQPESKIVSATTPKQPDVRATLASRFRRMLRLHDRARHQWLASAPPQPR